MRVPSVAPGGMRTLNVLAWRATEPSGRVVGTWRVRLLGARLNRSSMESDRFASKSCPRGVKVSSSGAPPNPPNPAKGLPPPRRPRADRPGPPRSPKIAEKKSLKSPPASGPPPKSKWMPPGPPPVPPQPGGGVKSCPDFQFWPSLS